MDDNGTRVYIPFPKEEVRRFIEPNNFEQSANEQVLDRAMELSPSIPEYPDTSGMSPDQIREAEERYYQEYNKIVYGDQGLEE